MLAVGSRFDHVGRRHVVEVPAERAALQLGVLTTQVVSTDHQGVGLGARHGAVDAGLAVEQWTKVFAERQLDDVTVVHLVGDAQRLLGRAHGHMGTRYDVNLTSAHPRPDTTDNGFIQEGGVSHRGGRGEASTQGRIQELSVGV